MIRRFLDSPLPYFALAAVLFLAAIASQFRPVRDDPGIAASEAIESIGRDSETNVVFILIDTLRADRLGSYGYARPTSPNLDALAARGIRFERVEAQSSWTKSSMASLWTSLYPQRTGVHRFSDAVPAAVVMPAERFREMGYRTAGIWRNGWVAPNFGFDQGFDLYHRPARGRGAGRIERAGPSRRPLPGTDFDATESAREFLRGVGEDPFFLYVHYMDVHQYVHADSSPDFGTSFSDLYDSSIHWTDRNVGMLIEELDRTGLSERTMIIVAADHGEAFHEHGIEGHARNLYREVQHTPLLIALPDAIDGGLVISEQVANVDLWPTIFDLLGEGPGNDLEGMSLMPLIHEAAGLETSPDALAWLRDRAVFSQLDQRWGRIDQDPLPLTAIVDDEVRMISTAGSGVRAELYDHRVDPLEKQNRFGFDEARDQMLSDQVEAFRVQAPRFGVAPRVEVDELQAAQLRALGYAMTPTGKKMRPNRGAGEAVDVPR